MSEPILQRQIDAQLWIVRTRVLLFPQEHFLIGVSIWNIIIVAICGPLPALFPRCVLCHSTL